MTICNSNAISFIVDEMCGKLARWLRLLGFDTLYYSSYVSQVDDTSILSKAAIEKRVLITRDKELYHRAVELGIKVILIMSDELREKLKDVLLINLNCNQIIVNPRCPICNGVLKKIPKEQVKGRVPFSVYQRINTFLKCVNCGKIYWFGSHWDKIIGILGEIGIKIFLKNNV